jgi:hypothetical protein
MALVQNARYASWCVQPKLRSAEHQSVCKAGVVTQTAQLGLVSGSKMCPYIPNMLP